jgi:hypothetical protein
VVEVSAAPDYIPGDPALHIVGKPDEQPAKKYGKPKPKPTKTARGISADIKHRMQLLEPLLEEYEVLKKLDAILDPPPPKRGRPKKK